MSEQPSQYDRATAVRAADDGSLVAEIDPVWSIGGRTNGGYLLSVMGRAAALTASALGLPHADVLAASATYLSPAPPGPLRLDVELLRSGRSQAVLRVRASSEGQHRAEALVTCGELDRGTAALHDAVPVPALPPLAQCRRLPVDGPGFAVPIMGVLAEHLDPACLGWAVGEPSRQGELRGYLSFADGREPDALSLLLAVDCLPPATFDLGVTGWVPTLHLSAWVRSAPAPGPLVVRQTARLVQGRTVDETCDVWDSRGRLVATGHQLAGIRLPD